MNNSTKWILEFTPSLEDSQNFMAYYLDNSPQQRKKRLIEGLTAGCIVLLSIFSCLYVAADLSPVKSNELSVEELISLGILAFILGFAVFILYPGNRKKQIVKNLEKIYNENGAYAPDKWVVSINESEIKISSEKSEGMMRWDLIDRIIINGDYIYLDKGGMNATIIPKRAFKDDGQRNEFIEYIKQVHAVATNNQL